MPSRLLAARMAESDSTHPPASVPQRGKRLDSWKEIAAYLNRDVTTVRRWEKREGLPVHRHRHDAQDSVYAFTEEIDIWRSGRGIVQPSPPPQPVPSTPGIVGRTVELNRLQTLLSRALDGTRQTVFITG